MRKMVRFLSLFICCWVSFVFVSCESLPGKPSADDQWIPPNQVTDFKILYAQSCAGCHGKNGRLGAARPLNDPIYLALITKQELIDVISHGTRGTSMPAFAKSSGGTLSDRQIESLVAEMISTWARPQEVKNVELPPYSIQSAVANGSGPGDPVRGSKEYATYCAQCHGTDGTGGKAGSIVDKNYLALVSDQGLRTTVILGRSDLGKPDWRGYVSGKPMTAKQISDVVAWLTSHRAVSENQQGANP
jgi:mono/diheme cytochrome c family protein